ncbi:MAG: AraC family transcriptional regulator [Candidatus Lambdaproteobacteria bacterium]|nr:AraC family transcriptional regulator [Candidatus Lambdaproteobacteria bacterium]
MESPVDLISSLLRTFHLNSNVFKHARFCGQWSLDTTGSGQAAFHLVASGDCWLHRPDDMEPTALHAGDLLILPRDAPHLLSDSTAPPSGSHPDVRPFGDRAAEGTDIVCGYFGFDEGTANPLLDALPDYLIVPGSAPGNEAMRRVVALLVAEAADAAPGVDAVLDRLSDALFILAMRAFLRSETGTGLAAALADPAVHRTLQLMHEAPGRDWTLEELARQAAVSRSGLVQRFSATMGEPPMAYLGRWRMTLARRWLQAGLSVADVAERCGYASETGFAKAFKRVTGAGPGSIRRGNP